MITLKKIDRSTNSVSYQFDYPENLGSVFNHSELKFEYDVNITSVPDSVILIPYISNLIPIAWAYDVDLAVPEIDYYYKKSLKEVRKTFAEFYPDMVSKTENCGIKSKTTVKQYKDRECHRDKTSNKTSLFSGGLDSLTTYVRHQNKPLEIVSINKYKDEYSGNWESIKDQIKEFADEENVKPYFIRSNLYYLTDHSYLEEEFSESIYTTWWQNVQHGLSYLSACAPLCDAEDISTLYIASTHTSNYDRPWGSHPDIDNKINWAGTECIHDGYELSRQEKWQKISDYFEPRGGVFVQSCGEPGNCNECFHCSRNIIGLILEELDPNKYGYNVHNKQFEQIRENIETGVWEMDADHRFFWEDLQRHIPDDPSSTDLPSRSKPFFKWLKTVDLSQFDPEQP